MQPSAGDLQGLDIRRAKELRMTDQERVERVQTHSAIYSLTSSNPCSAFSRTRQTSTRGGARWATGARMFREYVASPPSSTPPVTRIFRVGYPSESASGPTERPSGDPGRRRRRRRRAAGSRSRAVACSVISPGLAPRTGPRMSARARGPVAACELFGIISKQRERKREKERESKRERK